MGVGRLCLHAHVVQLRVCQSLNELLWCIIRATSNLSCHTWGYVVKMRLALHRLLSNHHQFSHWVNLQLKTVPVSMCVCVFAGKHEAVRHHNIPQQSKNVLSLIRKKGKTITSPSPHVRIIRHSQAAQNQLHVLRLFRVNRDKSVFTRTREYSTY